MAFLDAETELVDCNEKEKIMGSHLKGYDEIKNTTTSACMVNFKAVEASNLVFQSARVRIYIPAMA